MVRPDKKKYLFSIPARPEKCPQPQYFLFFFIFVKYNFSGAIKCVFKYTCTRNQPFSFAYWYPSKYAWHFCALTQLSQDDHGRRLKVVIVEGFRLFTTMAFVICSVTKEGSSTPKTSLAVDLIQMYNSDHSNHNIDSDVSLSTFYHEFCNGKFDDQPVEDVQ